MNRLTALPILLCLVAATATANDLHPNFPILDQQGQAVIASGQPMSTMQTCGGCHDTAFIEASSDHADAGASQPGNTGPDHPWEAGPGYYGGWDPVRYEADVLDDDGNVDPQAWLKRYGSRHVGGGPVAHLIEMDCLLCHTDINDNGARSDAIANGDFSWANSMSLQQSDILSVVDGIRVWNAGAFETDGTLKSGFLDISKPNDENCARCHGTVSNELEKPLSLSGGLTSHSMTERTGQIISPQKLVNSGLNLADKESLTRPFDVHSDRVLGCVNCHYSLNNPVYFRQRAESSPDHLEFDPRRLGSADYLTRPLHQFAKGQSVHGLAAASSTNSMRGCASCHDASQVHEWLPYKARHFNSLACETCHIPSLYGPALQTIDWTMLDSEHEPIRQYRGVNGEIGSAATLINGYRPVLLPRINGGQERKLAPFNLVTSWFWLNGEPATPVTRAQLQTALFSGGEYHADVIAGLDSDGDGQLRGIELRLDSPERSGVIRKRLQDSGLDGLRMGSEITPFPISHNVVNGRWATRDCANCHSDESILAAPFTLSGYLPGGELPSGVAPHGISFDGLIETTRDGSTEFRPDARQAGFYIIGLHSVSWVDRAGVLMFAAVWIGVLGHAIGRYISRRRGFKATTELKRVYMYRTYERLWHWIQTIAILLLLFTGLIIHKPDVFSIFSFPYVVDVHNVLGFILLINAALSLFYHLASGEIQQYLPEPRDFFARAIIQAMYYSRGIFRGEGHPFEKSKHKKLNPLQQITYLGILNVLLPAQVITGILIWGAQRWPEIANALGGLPLLAPLHTLIAWLFATFIVMHVYLTTAAGHTPTAGIQSMVTGWEDVEKHPGPSGNSAAQE